MHLWKKNIIIFNISVFFSSNLKTIFLPVTESAVDNHLIEAHVIVAPTLE